ncbi:MAG: hypothetical protein WAM14_12335 [Candidatus Nitrosopolaris sp.]
MKIYESATYGIRMQYSSNWEEDSIAIGTWQRFTPVVSFHPSSGDPENLMVYVDNEPTDHDLDGYLKDVVNYHRNDPLHTDFTIIGSNTSANLEMRSCPFVFD